MKRIRILAFLMAAALLAAGLAGCGGKSNSPGSKEPSGPFGTDEPSTEKDVRQLAQAVYPTRDYKTEDELWEAEQQSRNRATEEFKKAYGAFAGLTADELFRGSDGNVIYSPLSLYYALALSACGAEGETQAQLLDLLGWDSAEALKDDCRNLFEAFYWDRGIEGGYKFQMADSLWYQEGLPLKEEFLSMTRGDFYGDIFQGDFSSAAMKSAMAAWVKEHTGGLIQPEAEKGKETEAGDSLEMLHILNTIYYYVEWQYQFNSEETKPDTFYVSDQLRIPCDFMNMSTSGTFYRGDGYLMATLGTKQGSVDFILPDKGVDVRSLLTSPQARADILGKHQEGLYGDIVWKIPKISYGAQFSLKEILMNLGITDAFSDENADFSGMTDDPVWIDTVKQAAHIGINEEGIEAAAFTDLGYCGAGMPQDHAEMILDRPFLYVIRDDFCGSMPVFIGICENPAEDGAGGASAAAGKGSAVTKETDEADDGEEETEPAYEKLTSAPEITLQDARLSSTLHDVSVQSSTYSWNYADEEHPDQMTGLTACGEAPLDSGSWDVVIPVSEADRSDGAPYTVFCPVTPDSVTVREWDASSMEASEGLTSASAEGESGTYKETAADPFILLRPDRIYEIILDWSKDKLAERKFYGRASYVIKTAGKAGE